MHAPGGSGVSHTHSTVLLNTLLGMLLSRGRMPQQPCIRAPTLVRTFAQAPTPRCVRRTAVCCRVVLQVRNTPKGHASCAHLFEVCQDL